MNAVNKFLSAVPFQVGPYRTWRDVVGDVYQGGIDPLEWRVSLTESPSASSARARPSASPLSSAMSDADERDEVVEVPHAS